MASIHPSTQDNALINRNLVNFRPVEFEKIKETLLRRVDVLARAFCETQDTMINAIKSGTARIGTVDDYEGSFCIYIEFQGTQVLKPVHSIH